MGSHLRGVEILGAILFLLSISNQAIAVSKNLHTNKCLQLGLGAHQENQQRETGGLSPQKFISEIVEICRFIEKISRETGLDCSFASLALQEYDLLLKKLPLDPSKQQQESFNVSTQATVLQAPSDVFPEAPYNYLPTALTFSGGGNRALVAEAGQLRAFHTLDLISKVGYQSAVSGGLGEPPSTNSINRGLTMIPNSLDPPLPPSLLLVWKPWHSPPPHWPTPPPQTCCW